MGHVTAEQPSVLDCNCNQGSSDVDEAEKKYIPGQQVAGLPAVPVPEGTGLGEDDYLGNLTGLHTVHV